MVELARPRAIVSVDEETIHRVPIGLVGKLTAEHHFLKYRRLGVQAGEHFAERYLAVADLQQPVALWLGDRQCDPAGAQ